MTLVTMAGLIFIAAATLSYFTRSSAAEEFLGVVDNAVYSRLRETSAMEKIMFLLGLVLLLVAFMLSVFAGASGRRVRKVSKNVFYASAEVKINAPRKQVWEFIKPAENNPLHSPGTTYGFSAPGIPEGAGEIQVFISNVNGVESIAAIRVIEEIPYELAVTSPLGDPTYKGRTSLEDSDDGGTLFTHGSYFSIPAGHQNHAAAHKRQVQEHCEQYVSQIKALMEKAPVA
ncbi:SRPBCC family protein [Arthrobacter cavernae]|uniref:SRPBCC family protein n=1 Tax=Arthrobacter cavernae TaxID=2817681 RepID=A0A939HHQ4_9MICC|nr:SRPBCC family protein [Arthrobacter cavernae]MBO1268076.1 SRPBCC family protein [Arthrobacter cavernae]